MDLSSKHTKYLRGLAHSLDTVVTVGQSGLSDGVLKETGRALTDHELIKVKLPAGDKDARRALLGSLGEATESSVVQLIGRVGVLYRAAEPPVIQLPAI